MHKQPRNWLIGVALSLSLMGFCNSGCDSSRDHAGRVNVGGSGEGTAAKEARPATPEGGQQGSAGTSWDAARRNAGVNEDLADASRKPPADASSDTRTPSVPDLAEDPAADSAQSSSGRSLPRAR